MSDTIPERLCEEELLAVESNVCSYSDTVHYADRPKLFETCEGSYLYDAQGTPYLDLQMWYSAVSLGYGNQRINDSLKQQIDKLPQLACQFLHREKVQLAQLLAESIEHNLGEKGRIHFNVGGAQAVEDALKLVRKTTGKSRMLAFEGGYHGRTLARPRSLHPTAIGKPTANSVRFSSKWSRAPGDT